MKEQTPFSAPIPTPLREKVLELFRDEDQFLSGRASSAARSDLGTLYDSLRRIWSQASLEKEERELRTLSNKLELLREKLSSSFENSVTEYEGQLRRKLGIKTDWPAKLSEDTESWKSDINSRKKRLEEKRTQLEWRKLNCEVELQQKLSDLESDSRRRKEILNGDLRHLESQISNSEEALMQLEKKAKIFPQEREELRLLSKELVCRTNLRQDIEMDSKRISESLKSRSDELQRICSELEELEESSAIFRTRLLEAGKIAEDDYPVHIIKRRELGEG